MIRVWTVKSSFVAGLTRKPAWVSPEPISDVTYPIHEHTNDDLQGVSGSASAGTAHTHTEGSYSTSTALYGSNQNESTGSFVTITDTVVMDTVGFIASKSVSGMNNIYAEVFREAVDRSLSRIVSIDVSSLLLTGTSSQLSLGLGQQIVCQAGERYVFRLRNSSTVAGTAWLMGKQWGQFGPDIAFYTSGATATNRTSLTTAQADAARGAGGVIVWCMLAQTGVDEPEVSYSDDFNRESLGSEWISDGIVISGGKASYGGTTDGDQTTMRIRRTTLDASMVRGNLYVDEDATTQQLGIRLHCDREETQSVELLVTGTDAKIYSYASGTPTEQASVDVGGTDLYSLYYDEPNDKYVALKNGAEFDLEWTSVGGTVDHGSDFRFGGIRIIRDSGVNAGTIDNWTLTDYAA